MTAPIPDGKSDLPSGPLVAWYGDDFTGAGAVMEVLAFAGLEAVLFTDIPTAEELARFPKAQGIGIASTARAQTPAWMVKHLPKAFDALKQTGAPVLHYKTCSTLDSAPHIGSIGCAMDIAAREIPSPWVPILLAAPTMRRYQAFGHLFASAPEGVFRLDRHPVMAHHPVTPMAESDVAAHLRRQTDLPLGCVTLEDLAGDPTQAVAGARAAGLHGLSLDAISDTHMAQLGQLIWQEPDSPLFAVGSQGVEYALVAYWQLAGLLAPPPAPKSAGEVERMVAVSGSVSPVTAAQIAWAEENGFDIIQLDASALAKGDDKAEAAGLIQACAAYQAGRDPLIVTARGPKDPQVAKFRDTIQAAGISEHLANARIGAALGRILAELLRKTGARRAVISGGYTSGHACAELGLFAFTALAPTIPGAALLTGHSHNPKFDGLQIALKGGQMGSPDYFGWIKRGGGPAQSD